MAKKRPKHGETHLKQGEVKKRLSFDTQNIGMSGTNLI